MKLKDILTEGIAGVNDILKAFGNTHTDADTINHMANEYAAALEHMLEKNKNITVIHANNVYLAIKKFQKQEKLKHDIDVQGFWGIYDVMDNLQTRIDKNIKNKHPKFINRNIKLVGY